MSCVRHLRNKRKEKAARIKRLATVLLLEADGNADDELLALLVAQQVLRKLEPIPRELDNQGGL
ncbi:hypothetical protein DFH11DRAFT_1724356 [Phellopilus nigrolimitatus]|nr:hypothetical protein DFH11DRAFT_1724356 [Phellopilus nigrolimitatus]